MILLCELFWAPSGELTGSVRTSYFRILPIISLICLIYFHNVVLPPTQYAGSYHNLSRKWFNLIIIQFNLKYFFSKNVTMRTFSFYKSTSTLIRGVIFPSSTFMERDAAVIWFNTPI